jgi:hypothetical protein
LQGENSLYNLKISFICDEARMSDDEHSKCWRIFGKCEAAMYVCRMSQQFFADFQMLYRARQLARTTFVSVTGLVEILPKIFPENIKRLFLSNFFSNLQ